MAPGVVLEWTCTGTTETGIDVTGSDKIVTIEDVNIRGYTYGIECNGNKVRVFRCRFEENDDGIFGPGTGDSLHVVDSVFHQNSGAGIFTEGGGSIVVERRQPARPRRARPWP